jgi:hypothetical protein
MSIGACKECGHQISSDAKVCPQCGKKQQLSAGAGCLAIIGVLILLGIVGSLTQHKNDTPPPQPGPAEIQARKEAQERARQIEEQYLKTPAGELWQKHKDWDRKYCQAIINRKVMTGMNPAQVRAAWGRPERINRTVLPGYTTEQWVYGDTYLYFDDGVLTSWQDSR